MKSAQRISALSLLCALSACGEARDAVAPSAPPGPSLSLSAATVPVIYSNFGPGMAFDSNPFHAWTINGYLGPTVGRQVISQQFTPATTARFGSAQVAMSVLRGPDRVAVYLQQADQAGLPGAVIEKIVLAGLTATPSVLTATSVLRPQLDGGVPYWLTVVADTDSTLAGWNWNSIGDAAPKTFTATQGGSPYGPWVGVSTATRSVFQINAAPTPQALASAMIDEIRALAAQGTLTNGQAQGLIAKLAAAVPNMDSGRSAAACGQLSALLSQVQAFVTSGRLDAATGDELAGSIESIRDMIGC